MTKMILSLVIATVSGAALAQQPMMMPQQPMMLPQPMAGATQPMYGGQQSPMMTAGMMGAQGQSALLQQNYGYPLQQVQGAPGVMPGQANHTPSREGERPADETRGALGCGPGNYGRISRDGFTIDAGMSGSHTF